MKSTCLTLSGAVCCSLLTVAPLYAQNSSPWPRRPAEFERARRCIEPSELKEQKLEEAVSILKPYVNRDDVVGREARKITAAVNVRRYLSRLNPHAECYVVKKGDTLAGIVRSTGCPAELVMLLNGMSDPARLLPNTKMVVVTMKLRVEFSLKRHELCVWDEDTLVAMYDVVSHSLPAMENNVYAKVKAKLGYLNQKQLHASSTEFLMSERVILLDNNVSLTGAETVEGHYVQLQPADVNELALLLSVGGDVLFVCVDEEAAEVVEK